MYLLRKGETDMNIEIKDIGKIEYANITLDGITIIAGENNTGKSTIGKTVFSVFNGMSDWQKIYYKTCAKNLMNIISKLSEDLEEFCLQITGAIRRRTNRINQLIEQLSYDKDFIACVEDYKYSTIEKDKQDAYYRVEVYLTDFCQNYVSVYQGDSQSLMKKFKQYFDGWIRKAIIEVEEKVELDERILQRDKIKSSFEHCFKSQYIREGQKTSCIKIIDDDKEYSLDFRETEINISSPIRFDRSVYFIETPKLFDEIGSLRSVLSAKEELQRLMVPNSFLDSRKTIGYRLFFRDADDKFENMPVELDGILKMLREEMGGYAHYYAREGIKFKENGLKNPINAQNVSTGLKAMAFLEYALRIGAIQKGDVLVLDEPEINLHPEWQVSYARALVILHQKYNLTILITSHSPYFIRAIECLSDKYGVMDYLNVYMVDKDVNGKQRIDNVMESEYGMTELYDRLSAPLDGLQEEINRKYD